MMSVMDLEPLYELPVGESVGQSHRHKVPILKSHLEVDVIVHYAKLFGTIFLNPKQASYDAFLLFGGETFPGWCQIFNSRSRPAKAAGAGRAGTGSGST